MHKNVKWKFDNLKRILLPFPFRLVTNHRTCCMRNCGHISFFVRSVSKQKKNFNYFSTRAGQVGRKLGKEKKVSWYGLPFTFSRREKLFRFSIAIQLYEHSHQKIRTKSPSKEAINMGIDLDIVSLLENRENFSLLLPNESSTDTM